MADGVDSAVVLVHRFVGYPLAFIVAPLALVSFAGAPGHRAAGRWYVIAMTFLYLTGTSLTLTRYDWATWEFARNLSFNFLGFSLLFFGFRAMWLISHPDAPRPAALDRAMLGVLIVTVAAMAAVASQRSGPMFGIAVAGILLLLYEVRDWRRGFAAADLYRRHVRYMIGSYCYVLTVVSLVHLRDELSSDARWLWPAVMGVLVIGASTGTRWPLLRRHRTAATLVAMRALLAVAVLFGIYVAWELLSGAA